jgi:hypothetical protein
VTYGLRSRDSSCKYGHNEECSLDLVVSNPQLPEDPHWGGRLHVTAQDHCEDMQARELQLNENQPRQRNDESFNHDKVLGYRECFAVYCSTSHFNLVGELC